MSVVPQIEGMHDSGGGPSSGGAGAPLLLPSSSGNLTPCASLTPQPARKKVMGTKPQQQQPYRINNCKFEQSMIRFLRELHSSRQYTDVALHAEGRLLHAHRVVLAAGSGYFSVTSVFSFHSTSNQPSPKLSGRFRLKKLMKPLLFFFFQQNE